MRVPLKLMPFADVRAFTPLKAGKVLDTPMPRAASEVTLRPLVASWVTCCAADQVAQLIGFRLDLQGVGLDGNRLSSAADRKADVFLQGLSGVHDDVGLGVFLKAWRRKRSA